MRQKLISKKRETRSISETHPELSKEAFGWDPTAIIAGTHKELKWKCKLGHVWMARGFSRIAGNKCPYCSNKKVLPGFNDMATTHPHLSKEAFGWDPTAIIAGTHKKLEWKCKSGHVWMARGNDRINKKSKCPYCSNKKVLPGFNDMATTHPHLSKEAFGWDPTKIITTTHKKLNWRCEVKHEWIASGYIRAKGNKCPYCSNKKYLKEFRQLA